MAAYVERGRLVEVLVMFRSPSKKCPPTPCPSWLIWNVPPRGAPRNCLIRREDGELVVRPFRGLRRLR